MYSCLDHWLYVSADVERRRSTFVSRRSSSSSNVAMRFPFSFCKKKKKKQEEKAQNVIFGERVVMMMVRETMNPVIAESDDDEEAVDAILFPSWCSYDAQTTRGDFPARSRARQSTVP